MSPVLLEVFLMVIACQRNDQGRWRVSQSWVLQVARKEARIDEIVIKMR